MENAILLSGISVDDFMHKVRQTVVETIHAEKEAAPPKQSNPNYLTRLEVAERLNISLPTLNEYTKRGIVPAYRIGARVLYKESDINNSLNQIRVK